MKTIKSFLGLTFNDSGLAPSHRDDDDDGFAVTKPDLASDTYRNYHFYQVPTIYQNYQPTIVCFPALPRIHPG